MESNEEFSLMSIFNNESGMQNGYFHTEIEKIRKNNPISIITIMEQLD